MYNQKWKINNNYKRSILWVRQLSLKGNIWNRALHNFNLNHQFNNVNQFKQIIE